jgi:hypothetical protein
LHAEVGANPPIGELETALKTRVDELPREPEQGDPFEGADEYQLDRRRVVAPSPSGTSSAPVTGGARQCLQAVRRRRRTL